jgi:selenoprotein W-related protein
VSLTEHLLTTYQLQIKELKLIPSLGGVFEVTVNGDLVYSKKKTGKFPENSAIDPAIEQRLRPAK